VLNVDIPAEELERRQKTWTPRDPSYRVGVIAKYCKLVSSASEGAITR
jgi:dihydroxy-acid dehydratase